MKPQALSIRPLPLDGVERLGRVWNHFGGVWHNSFGLADKEASDRSSFKSPHGVHFCRRTPLLASAADFLDLPFGVCVCVGTRGVYVGARMHACMFPGGLFEERVVFLEYL